MVDEGLKTTGWPNIVSRIDPSGRNLRCACGRWTDILYIAEVGADPRCAGCLQRKDERKPKSGPADSTRKPRLF